MQHVSPRASVYGTDSRLDETFFWRLERYGDLDCFTATFRKHVFPPHTHETYVVGTVIEGLHCYMHKGRMVRTGPGHLCFINPGEVHDGAPVDGGYRYRMVYPTEALMQEIMGDATGRKEGPPRFLEPEVHDEEVAREFAEAHLKLEDGKQPLAADEALASVLVKAVQRHASSSLDLPQPGIETAAVARARDYLAAHVDQSVDLKTLAKVAGLSGYHLIRVFRKATGLSPHAWLVDRRVHLAAQLIRAGEPLSLVAGRCGFSDQSHLTRLFKARLGVTPGQYRALRH
jgi:AraC-like DNA-binding protein